VYDSFPPYTILANKVINFATMQRLVRFSRYWDLVANSGRFAHTLPVLLGDSPFNRFMAFSDWLYQNTDATHRIALDRLAKMVVQYLVEEQGLALAEAQSLIASDYAGKQSKGKTTAAPQRQAVHLAA
jgi:Protein of unknown function (DUF4080)